MAAPTFGDIKINGKSYRVDLNTYRVKDIIDFAPRASVPGGSVVMSDLSLYQPLVQTDWRHGMGFQWNTDDMGYLSTVGNVDTRHDGLSMLYTKSVSSDTDNNSKSGMLSFKGKLYSWGAAGIRKYTGGVWSLEDYVPYPMVDSRGSKAGSAATITLTVNIPNVANRAAIVALHTKSNVNISAATLGGDAMTTLDTSGTAPKTFLLYLASPATGNKTVSITLSGSSVYAMEVLLAYNVDTTSIFSATVKESGTAATVTTSISAAATKLVISAVTVDSNVALTAAATQTEVEQTLGASVAGATAYRVGAGGATAMTWSWTGSLKFEHIIVALTGTTGGAVNGLLSSGDYLFALPYQGRIMKYNGTAWTYAGLDSTASDFLWGIVYNGYIFVGERISNRMHYSAEDDAGDLEGGAGDAGLIRCGLGNVPTIAPIIFSGNLYVTREDGLWQIGTDFVARRMIDYSNDGSSSNFRGIAVINGFVVFSIRDRVIQWNGARVADITPFKITDEWPYVEYGQYAYFVSVNDFLYVVATTNEATPITSLICWDGVGWHKLCDLATASGEVVTALNYDVTNDSLWFHVSHPAVTVTNTTSYIKFNTNSAFPYAAFPTTGQHSLITSRLDMGFRRVQKSMVSLWVEARNILVSETENHTIDVYYSLDGGAWVKWGSIVANGLTELVFPALTTTTYSVEFNHAQLRFDFITDTAAQSPLLESWTMRFIMRPETAMGYNFNIIAATDYQHESRESLKKANTIISELRTVRNSKPPVTFLPLYGTQVYAYLTAVSETPVWRSGKTDAGEDRIEYVINCNLVEVG